MTLNQFRWRILICTAVLLFFPLILALFSVVLSIISGGIGGIVYTLVFLKPVIILVLIIYVAHTFWRRLPKLGVSKNWALLILFMLFLSYGNLSHFWLYFKNLQHSLLFLPLIIVLILAGTMCTINFSRKGFESDKLVNSAWLLFWGDSILACLLSLPNISDPLNSIPHGWKMALQLNLDIRAFIAPIWGINKFLPISLQNCLLLVICGSLGFVAIKTKQ